MRPWNWAILGSITSVQSRLSRGTIGECQSTIDFFRHTSLPTAFIAADRDSVAPFRRSESLRLVIPNLIFDCKITDAGHNDPYDHPAFKDAMREALARIEASAGAPVG